MPCAYICHDTGHYRPDALFDEPHEGSAIFVAPAAGDRAPVGEPNPGRHGEHSHRGCAGRGLRIRPLARGDQIGCLEDQHVEPAEKIVNCAQHHQMMRVEGRGELEKELSKRCRINRDFETGGKGRHAPDTVMACLGSRNAILTSGTSRGGLRGPVAALS